LKTGTTALFSQLGHMLETGCCSPPDLVATAAYIHLGPERATAVNQSYNSSSKCVVVMNKPRILVVEDNPVEQKLITMLSVRYGVEAVIAATAYRALQLLEEDVASPSFSAILMNFMLPAMSGLECTVRIRESEQGTARRIPIIAVTAAVTESTRDICMEVGMDDYLAKPYSVEDFRRLLERWVFSRVKATA
jgi:CheY-like chemotaxis protein